MIALAGRVVVVTGGTQGVGRGIAERFLCAGAEVLVCARKPPQAHVTAAGRTAGFEALNVRIPEEIDRVLAQLQARFGRLDVWVNNAGGSPPSAAATASPRFTASIVDLNLTAALVCAQKANALMQRQPEGGVIINIASLSGLRASPGTAAYGAAKAGLINATQSLAMEWAPRVRVNAVSPGMVQTELLAEHLREGLAEAAASVPLARLATPGDVGDACVFLASPLASYVTGANLVLHGGGERLGFLPPPA